MFIERKTKLNLDKSLRLETEFTVFGGYSVGVTPVLIPNTEVKSYSADDTALETMWESRSPPKLFAKALLNKEGFGNQERPQLPASK